MNTLQATTATKCLCSNSSNSIRQNDFFQTAAVQEHPFRDACDIFRNIDAGEATASIESADAKAGHGIAKGHRFQTFAVEEGLFANGGDIISDHHTCQIAIDLIEGIITNAGNTIFNDYRDNILAPIKPRRQIGVGIIVIHITRTGNSQHTIIRQHPGQVVATGAACQQIHITTNAANTIIIIVSRRLTLRRTANRAGLRFRASRVLPCMVAVHHPGDRATIILHHVTRPGCIAHRIVSRSHDTLECITTITGRITQEHDFS